MIEKILGNKKILLLIDITLLIICIICYKEIYSREISKSQFSIEAEKFSEENQNPVFRVNKIVLYSSAHAVDNSENEQLEDIDISQFTDLAIYVDNKKKIEETTAENTINEMFIDNIRIDVKGENGEKIINYKSPKEFGKYVSFENYQNDGILFNVIHTNDEQQNADYANNIFYTDCSNPISLGFINRNILTNCKISNANGMLSFDGSILKNANIDLEKISAKISFSIHIKNNLGEDFVCNLEIENDLKENEEEIFSGYVMKILNTDEDKYNFLKVSN